MSEDKKEVGKVIFSRKHNLSKFDPEESAKQLATCLCNGYPSTEEKDSCKKGVEEGYERSKKRKERGY